LVAAGIDQALPSPTRFDLAGFSLGAIIGGLVAARLAARVRTFVLLGPGGLGLTPAPVRTLQRLLPRTGDARRARASCSVRALSGWPPRRCGHCSGLSPPWTPRRCGTCTAKTWASSCSPAR